MNKGSNLRWLWVTIFIILLDQWTKYLTLKNFMLGESKQITNFFNITLAYNRGAAFNFLSNSSGWQVWFLTAIAIIVSIIILIWMGNLPKRSHWMSCALALILGGALGNLWDRVTLGHVIDFIDFYFGKYHWPAFNVADSAVCVGVIMLIIGLLTNKKTHKKIKKKGKNK